jgi:hypothetical protein
MGHSVAQLVEALRYKLEGPGFGHWNFSLRFWDQTEMSTRNISWG